MVIVLVAGTLDKASQAGFCHYTVAISAVFGEGLNFCRGLPAATPTKS
jgi:hypothetical protein